MRELQDYYIVYRCRTCGKHFVLFSNEVKHSEEESTYLTCSYNGKHKDIIVCGRYESIKECMDHDSYKRINGKIKQR